MDAVSRLRLLGRLEGLSFLVLVFVAMPIKYVGGNPIAVKVFGPIHGILFLGYVFDVLVQQGEQRWPRTTTALALVASLLPFGPFLVEGRIAAAQASQPSNDGA